MLDQLTIILVAALAGPLLGIGRRLAVPVVVGELVAGVVLGRTGFGAVDPGSQPLPSIKAIGFAMLMLTAGTHVDITSTALRRGLARGVLAFSVTALLSVVAGYGTDALLGVSHPALLSVLLAGSSAAVAFPILSERGITGPAVATVTAWVALADVTTVIVMPLTVAGSTNLVKALAGDLLIVVTAVVVCLVAERLRLMEWVTGTERRALRRGWALRLRFSIVLLLGLTVIADRTGGSALLAGFGSGMVLARLKQPDHLAVELTGIANGFFVPAFFVILGSELDLRALVQSATAIELAVALAALAVVVHVVAGLVAVSEGRVAAGLAASAQLGMPAAAASLGLADHALSPAIAAALVSAACVTLIPATVGAYGLAVKPAPEHAAPPAAPVAPT